MALDPERLLAHRFEPIRQTYTARDTILYALGVGLGQDPLAEDELDYLIETRGRVLPTFAATLASPAMWMRDPAFGIDFARLVHVEQEAIFTAPLPPAATVVAVPRVASLDDRGAGRGAVLVVERTIRDETDGVTYATIRQTLLLRGDGGFGGNIASSARDHVMPDRSPDLLISLPVSLRAALIYRLSGDWNPLHADPSFAKKAGFDRPILQGLATYGMVGWAITSALQRRNNGEPTPLRSICCRFTGIVHPGDRIDLALRFDGATVFFDAHVKGRRVLSQGRASAH